MSASVLRRPYDAWTAAELLAHFRSRAGVRYFPVLDAEHTTRAKIDDVLDNRFDFNGEVHQLAHAFDWTVNPSRDIEWLILLHKFYYAVGLGKVYRETADPSYVRKWIELTASWIETTPQGFLTSDVAGRRIQNWIYAHYYFVSCDGPACIPPAFYLQFLTSLAQQVNDLCEHLTPARNHRTIELYAIFLAAVAFPEFCDAARWLCFATAELAKNICTDFLPDGVHCELSTDYHHLALKNMLNARRLARLNGVAMPQEMDDRIRKGLDFALYAHKPDGSIPALSDGDSRSFLDLLMQGYDLYQDKAMGYVATQGACGTPPAVRSKAFPHGGYYIQRSGWGEAEEPFQDARYLIFDCGPLGRGNHGHLDLLSFEMAAYGQSLIVDPGRYTYDESGETNWRARFRGTAYHNTVQVDQREQTRYEFYKTRYKIRGPEPLWELKQWVCEEGLDVVHGAARSHEYEVIHERVIAFMGAACGPDYWLVSDVLQAAEPHEYDLRFHLSDQAYQQVFTSVEAGAALAHAPHLVIAQPEHPSIHLAVEDGYVSRAYGVKRPAPIVRFSQRASNAAFHTVLYPYKTCRPQIQVARAPVFHGGRQCAEDQAFAVCVTVSQQGQSFKDIFFRAELGGAGPYTFADVSYEGALLWMRFDAAGRLIRRLGDRG